MFWEKLVHDQLVVTAVKLTVNEQRLVAQKANWYFDVFMGLNTGDSVVYTGDGVDDLDHLITVLAAGTGRSARFVCDVSPGNYSVYRAFDMDDLQAIRGYFIGWYGTVNKPDAYTQTASVALPQQSIQVLT